MLYERDFYTLIFEKVPTPLTPSPTEDLRQN